MHLIKRVIIIIRIVTEQQRLSFVLSGQHFLVVAGPQDVRQDGDAPDPHRAVQHGLGVQRHLQAQCCRHEPSRVSLRRIPLQRFFSRLKNTREHLLLYDCSEVSEKKKKNRIIVAITIIVLLLLCIRLCTRYYLLSSSSSGSNASVLWLETLFFLFFSSLTH